MELYKYQGAGNDFLICDDRDGLFRPTAGLIGALCDRHYGIGADGLMLLEKAGDEGRYDFRMVYFNSDGSGGMMCGNGGRCITAFAYDLGIRPGGGSRYRFIADDGPHEAEILPAQEPEDGNEAMGNAAGTAETSRLAGAETAETGRPTGAGATAKTVRLKMKDVDRIMEVDVSSFFLDTGTRHFVKFTGNVSTVDVVAEGRKIRYMTQFAPEGTNVNFVEPDGGALRIRTYEKGVEDETLACGTGITAAAIATPLYYSLEPSRRADAGEALRRTADGRTHVKVLALRDELAVDFIETPAGGAVDVWLTGPAAYVCKVIVPDK